MTGTGTPAGLLRTELISVQCFFKFFYQD
jgi:hypothetical protein